MTVVVRDTRQQLGGKTAQLRPLLPGHEIPDADLVERARAGNRWAEEMLYRRHAQYLIGLCERLVRQKADTDDIVQDAFVSAFEQLAQLRDPAFFRRWLTGIAVHQAHRRLRKRKFLRLVGLADGNQHETLDAMAGSLASPETVAEFAQLDRILGNLSVSTRVAWQLRYIEGCRLDEVAEYCGCSLATVKRRITVADQRLRMHVDYAEVSDD